MNAAGLAGRYLAHPLQWPIMICHRKELTEDCTLSA
jgi:hypothetical protein